MLNVRDFGAKGDGKADDTQAIQNALSEATGARASVFVPEGVYLCSTIRMPPNTGLLGNPTWDYRHSRGIILRLADEKATCLIDITGAFGATLAGLRLRRWDGFVLANWFSGNTLAGYGAYEENASMAMTGNRIEWNAGGGIVIHGG